jgi:threonine synthase
MNYFISGTGRRFTILTATSGDTGSAVANAFHGLSNIEVIILFPRNEVSGIQRRQMTTLGGNVHTLSVDGKFDDCQRLVKTAFTDPALKEFSLSSANSINIGRLLPQTVYYFYSWSRLAMNGNEKAVFSVPSGNYGNLMGGILARQMGLPVKKFIISTNINDEVPEYLKTGMKMRKALRMTAWLRGLSLSS